MTRSRCFYPVEDRVGLHPDTFGTIHVTFIKPIASLRRVTLREPEFFVIESIVLGAIQPIEFGPMSEKDGTTGVDLDYDEPISAGEQLRIVIHNRTHNFVRVYGRLEAEPLRRSP